MQDCYFLYIEENESVECVCVECKNKYYPQDGWFWEGSKKGYGSGKVACLKCGKILSQNQEEYEI